ncbi:hypothetical protein DPMN_124033 [Dreissena polymorpha]|uniref:Uncharacterized protein n=1 Tax=Dreissena polymorpha TaxID=45954 RepID=A0A9D4JTG9_DREPO|nr:hypothetical protein DPMN_124033 [Dreissena polymorpha]
MVVVMVVMEVVRDDNGCDGVNVGGDNGACDGGVDGGGRNGNGGDDGGNLSCCC